MIIQKIEQYLGILEMYLLCVIIPGVLFIISGIRILIIKHTVNISRDANFNWRKPKIIKGRDALENGRFRIGLGLFLFLLGGLLIIGILQQ